MNVISFYLAYSFLWILTLLPLSILYIFSDVLFFIVYHLIAYRKKVIIENLQFAFPDKSQEEIQSIANKFYRHFCDSLVEFIKIIHMNTATINRRFRYKNFEIFNEIFDQNKSAVLVSAHYGNWEWMLDAQSKVKHSILAIYKPLEDKYFDRMIKSLRTKYANGARMVAMNDVYKTIFAKKKAGQKVITWFLADQTPPQNYPFWIDFMNRETPFFSGPAKISKKFDQPIMFMQINKIKRGYYEADFSMLVEHPENFSEVEIIEKYVRKIEDGIKERPEYWLWSHRRWKHKKKNNIKNQH